MRPRYHSFCRLSTSLRAERASPHLRLLFLLSLVVLRRSSAQDAAGGADPDSSSYLLLIFRFYVELGSLTMRWQKIVRQMSPLRTTGRFFQRHPWALCLLLFLLILYKYFFSWFTVLVTTSPIFLIAGIFLGIILAYGEPNHPEKDHVYKKIEKVHVQNIHDSGKSVGGVALPRIPTGDKKVVKHNNIKKKRRKRSHGVGSSSEPGSSVSGGSDADTTPMLHAFRHLRSGSNSSHSSQDGDSSDSSTEVGTQNPECKAGNLREGKDVKVVAWTADDQKNILKIGSLEIERNQRLESLIARRRARKYSDRNLVDIGSSDSLPIIEELSKFNVQIPAVFAPRKNPFDLPYNEDNFPDSAPSALLQTRNPFDLPHEQEDESSSAVGVDSIHEEPVSVASQLQRSALYRRHESFTKGAPFLSEFLQDARPSRLRPYFVTETTANEEITSSSIDGETSGKGSSKASSVQDSDSTSVTDQENQKDVLEDCSNQGQRSPFVQAEEHAQIAQHVREVSLALDMEPPVLISDSSDDDISLSGEHINDWVEAQHSQNLNFSHNRLLEDSSVMQHHQEIEMTSNGFHQMSPHSNDLDLTSSSTETTDDPFEVNDTELPANEMVVTDDTHILDPIYDSSPSGSDKPASIGLVIDAAVLQDGHAHTYDAEARIGDEGLSLRMETSSSKAATSSLHSVEQSEPAEKETSERRVHGTVEHDEAHEGTVSHAGPSVSDISSQPATESPSNGR
ncbi:hypothetical protein EJB05_12744, partial [Eragrostis curvula]